MDRDIDQIAIDTIRTLSIDAIQKANSGHPGTPMALAPARLHALAALPALRPRRPDLAGPRPLRALRRARLDAALRAAPPRRGAGGRPRLRGRRRALGQPRRHRERSASSARARPATPSTAGPPASRRPPARSARASPPRSGWRSPASGSRRRYGADLFDFDVYAIAGDGCLMEGVSNEAASIAGHLKLDNLCWIYDNNHITIDGNTRLAYEDDVAARFMGYGWNVTRVGDANDIELIATRLRGVQGRGGAPDADHRRQPHRLRLAAQAGHLRRPRRAARRGGGARDQARLRLAGGRPVPRPRRGPRALRRGGRRPRRRGARRVGGQARRLRRGRARARRRDRGPAAARAARGLGRRDPQLRARREGHRHPQGLESGRERDRRAPALAARRLRRPHRLDLGPPRASTAPTTSSPAPTTAASSTSASASTRRRRSATASRSPSCGRSGRPTSPSPTTRGRRSGSRR